MTVSARDAVPVPHLRPPGVPLDAAPPPVPVAPGNAGRRWSRRPRAERLEADYDALIAAHAASLAGSSRTVAVFGAKGGVGATTVTLLAGLLAAEVPGLRPLVVEIAPDGGAIAPQIGVQMGRNARDLLASLTVAHRDGLGFVQGFLAVWGRLPVLLAPPVLHGAAPLTPDDYAALLALVGRHYNLVLLDCGAAVTHPLARFACGVADHLLLVGQPDPVATVRTLALVNYLMCSPDHRRRDAIHLTAVINGSSVSAPPFFATPQWQEVLPQLNAALSLPHSEPLRRRLDAGSLAVETVPTDVRRATKGLLAPILGRLAHP